MNDSLQQQQIRSKLHTLSIEHRDLDETLARLVEQPTVDRLMVQRLKKRKLVLRDMISKLESMLISDIIA